MSSLQQVDQLIMDIESQLNVGAQQSGRVMHTCGYVMTKPFEKHCPICLIRSHKEQDIRPPVELSPIDLNALKKKTVEKSVKKSPKPVAQKEESSQQEADIETFAKALLLVGKIVEIGPVEGADKLLKGMIDVGGEQKQVVAGLKPFFDPSDLLNKEVVIAGNLKPSKMVGQLSEVMVLAGTGSNEAVRLVEPPSGASIGSRVGLEGHEQLPEPNKVCNSKTWNKIVPNLSVHEGVATFSGKKLVVGGHSCTCDLPNGSTIR
ncbi:hypothetical protein P9112_013971 [Eukaryota sp. TZLM1-RC]